MGLNARRLLVVEDEPLLASLVVEALRTAGFEVASAADVESARALIETFDPDMAVLDISLGNGPTGVHLAHALEISRPDIAILFLTRHPDAASASAEGVDVPASAGFLRKHMVNDTQHLLDAIEKVFADRAAEVRHDIIPGTGLDGLTKQAMTVLRLLAEGCSNSEIGRRCGLSVKSVERWIDTVYRQLDIDKSAEVNARVEAAKRYYLAVGIPQQASP
jgi:DNA-binding NarL/FixJ family response regulator